MRFNRRILKKKSGRDAVGHVSVRHQGGRHKRFLREIDFKRKKIGIEAKVEGLEYDPNRTAKIARLVYMDGGRGYILAPEGLEAGDVVEAGAGIGIRPGNSLPLGEIPVGTSVHNLEVRSGKGGQIVKASGAVAVVQGKEEGSVIVKLPSGEVRRFDPMARATVGGVVKVERERLGKAGKNRWRGIRPRVRGVAMPPSGHPHGGGEGRSGVGMPSPKTPWGKKARGVKTRIKRKYSDGLIIQRRK